ncbi:MAG TPA: hypothetical protein VIP11_14065 [Gemmatimonadaceae bacterium]
MGHKPAHDVDVWSRDFWLDWAEPPAFFPAASQPDVFGVTGAAITVEERFARRRLVFERFAEVQGGESSAMQAIESRTQFIVRAPKQNTVTRYLVNPQYERDLRRWAAETEADDIS